MDEAGFQIERAAADMVFRAVARVDRDITYYVDVAVEPFATYHYRVAAFNSAGLSAYTNVASITVGSTVEAPLATRVSNLSARAGVAPGEGVLVAGFVVTGLARKELLIRGVGPALGSFGVTGALANPVITLFDAAGRVSATNDDWNSAVTSPAMFAAAGAFPFPSNSTDAALRVMVEPGAYTIHVADTASRSGIALAEIYESDGSPARLANLSARAFISGGAAITIAGFVVKGQQPGRFLIRAVGPTLADFGVSNVLSDPTLVIMSGTGASVASNDNWNNAAAVITESTSVGAFALRAGSRDAAVVITLPSGDYTAQVSGVGSAAGVALVEIYELRN